MFGRFNKLFGVAFSLRNTLRMTPTYFSGPPTLKYRLAAVDLEAFRPLSEE